MTRPRKAKKGPTIPVGFHFDPMESAAEHMAGVMAENHPAVKRLKESTKKALLKTAKQVQKTRKQKLAGREA